MDSTGNQGLLGSQSRQRGDDKQATDDILSTKRKYDELEIAFGVPLCCRPSVCAKRTILNLVC
eukprot:SAG31_NODE_3289_length_4458_cov_2.567791_2_plen_63_part_00